MTRTAEKGLKLGNHQFPMFDGAAVAFGAEARDYPTYKDIPAQYHCGGHTPYNKAFSGLFYRGGRLSDYGLTFKPGIDENQAMRAIRALMTSWAPKHELKEATVAWALSEWCDYKPAA